jgi:hypothetical protein
MFSSFHVANFFTADKKLIVQSIDLARLIGRNILPMQGSQLILGWLVIATIVNRPWSLVKWRASSADPVFASNNDARANATTKTILLDMARSQSAIELRRKLVSSEWEITGGPVGTALPARTSH